MNAVIASRKFCASRCIYKQLNYKATDSNEILRTEKFQSEVLVNCIDRKRNRGFYRCFSSVQNREKNPYKILGVSQSATKKEIKKKYYELCQLYHPDKILGLKNKNSDTGNIDKKQNSKKLASKEENEEKFKQVQYAYETLSNNNFRPTNVMDGYSGFDYHNRAPFYYSQQQEENRYRQQMREENEKYGFYDNINNPNDNRTDQEKTKGNYAVGGMIVAATGVSTILLIAYIIHVRGKLTEAAERSHHEAAMMLRKAQLRSRGLNMDNYNKIEPEEFLKSTDSILKGINLPDTNESTNKDFLGMSPENSGDSTNESSHRGHVFYLTPTKDEQMMRFIATYDKEINGERMSFPYGKEMHSSEVEKHL
ncbi:hypothetical protein BB559_000997 [Furculomyces boomerangus]|uniref:J domain-containing protein n=2 Tax=Harpellales TaxID=61421 RepID=A0A2T9Z3G4_9FUNG|nr:hypothetical protein BB559_004502 [Furculomyces boomerangus]PVU99135.1 hypothetical protein BB559_000997 [Furculomyces boomerangus]PWA02934.1 hypothetical protein BB558_000898 [Smittium angustum]